MLTREEMLAIYAERAAADTACMLGRAVEIVAAQLETSHEVAPVERQWVQTRALEIAAKRYPELVVGVLDASAKIYAARIVATSPRICNASE